jgi:Lon protease-like protein
MNDPVPTSGGHHPHSRPGLYDQLEEAHELIRRLTAKLAEVAADRDEWKQQHENLVEVRRRDLAALAKKLNDLLKHQLLTLEETDSGPGPGPGITERWDTE